MFVSSMAKSEYIGCEILIYVQILFCVTILFVIRL